MAFGARKIFPIDTKPGTAVGVSLPFNAPAVFNSTYTTQDAIRNNLINFFLTDQPERYLNPLFGGNLRSFVFEQMSADNNEKIDTYLLQQLSQYFSNLEVVNLNTKFSPDINTVDISLTYLIKNTGITDSIQLEFN
jgi:phage baseplate assembly protein W